MNAAAPVITLDGPGGAGKGTLAGALATDLGWRLLDSGALYRVVGLYAARRGLEPVSDTVIEQVAQIARRLEMGFDTDRQKSARVTCAGEDVTAAIRSDAASAAASRWAALPAIRRALLARQRDFRAPPGLIADGRDMGTVIFPDAPLKLYVTASAAERAARRHAQLQPSRQLSTIDDDANLEQIYREILERDERDASRTASPLKPAADAIVIDTTGETVAASLEKVRGFIRQKGWL